MAAKWPVGPFESRPRTFSQLIFLNALHGLREPPECPPLLLRKECS